MLLIIFLVFAGLIFGAIGTLIAQNQGVSTTSGFCYGFFLGPLGLIIVALLKPTLKAQPASADTTHSLASPTFAGEADLSNDAYKIWLASQYNIQRNDVLGSYICRDRLFTALDEALGYARDQHHQDLHRQRTQAKREEVLIRECKEALMLDRANADRLVRKYFAGILILFLVFGTIFFIVRIVQPNTTSSDTISNLSDLASTDLTSTDLPYPAPVLENSDRKEQATSKQSKYHSGSSPNIGGDSIPETASRRFEHSGLEQARPLGDVRAVFSGDDYPAVAQAAGQEGAVQVKLTVDPQGKVSACMVLRSSRSKDLDSVTCDILKRRAHFSPAHDRSGNPVTSTYVAPPILWRLED